MFELPFFTQDGMYALELTAVDKAGNESVRNINTYARMIGQDVLGYIINSNAETKTGLYSIEYEDGTPVSKRPSDFKDLEIMVMAKEGTNVDIVLRDTDGGEKPVNTQITADHSVYGFTIYNLVVSADYFKDSFPDDIDTYRYLAIRNEDKRIDLGKIHIDGVAPVCDIPKGFSSWYWYKGEETRTITLTNISEFLDEERTKVLDNGEEID